MQLRKLDNPSFSTPQKPDRHKPYVTLVGSLYAYSHSAIRDATYIFVIVLGLVFCSSFPSWSTANEVMEGRIEVLFFGHAQVFQAEPMQLYMEGRIVVLHFCDSSRMTFRNYDWRLRIMRFL
ncbi:hypothetical protein E2542_SST12575 [Spatholobus suberectus]|nr:hypothetical protein E2542_SST12575 [Spatholobus suberectus]